jgi:hypothetical protein
MIRVVFTYIIPLLLPAAAYFAWAWYRARYVAAHSGEVPRLERGPWPQLLFAGALLMLATLAATALLKGNDPGGTYIPSHLENGQVVPGRTEPKS